MFKDFSQKSDLLERHTPVCLTPRVPPPPPGPSLTHNMSSSRDANCFNWAAERDYHFKVQGSWITAIPLSTAEWPVFKFSNMSHSEITKLLIKRLPTATHFRIIHLDFKGILRDLHLKLTYLKTQTRCISIYIQCKDIRHFIRAVH